MSKSDIPLLVEHGPLRIRYLEGRGRTLVVSFSGVGKKRSDEPSIEFPGIASAGHENHVLFVTDQSRSWLNGAGMADRIQRVVEATATHIKAERIVAIGNSMGGTMALHMSRLMDFERVIALTPQFSVAPGEIPEEDRWSYFRKRIKQFHFPRVEKLRTDTTKYFILHGDEPLELAHARRFPQEPGITHIIVPDTDHRLAEHLKQRKILVPLMQEVIAGRSRRFRRRLASIGGLPASRVLLDGQASTAPDLALAS
ncbi:alpha/beta fold hydrolase [Marivita geojedonensis]|uniref:Uncharacterized protein n=1 Tax=Marivita geojedonensis TaxID=1123756 RepID=A0A1X4NLD4_9RHOB|nr:alpha/beta fold hydrolase [Marivita geojedonensis]OSQ51054.1 hypothetical protein MGEO_10055 [Marivita geojedonensis]PRY79938.1 alpha/beta hydrolase family protein [Marivita geojedonensis]